MKSEWGKTMLEGSATPASRIEAFIRRVRASGLYPANPVVNSATTETRIWVGGREYLLFCSNNILGLSNHPEVKAAAAVSLERYGLGSGGSRQMAANIDVHIALEDRIAAFVGRESAICFAAGYMANVGAIPGLMMLDYLSSLDLETMDAGFLERRDAWKDRAAWAIFSEQLNHASGVDGIRLAHAERSIYPHKDMQALAAQVAASEAQSKLIISDGVFSMDGDIAPVDGIVEIARRHGAMVMIDDAHGVGVLGDGGAGTMQHLGLPPESVDLQMGTFTKAFGGVGGFIAGDSALIDFLRVSARTYIFSAPIPPGIAGGLAKAIDIAEREPWRREKALEGASYFRREVEALGYDTLGSEAHIVPVLFGAENEAARATQELRKMGIVAPSVRFPAVAPGRARIRFVITADHGREQIDYLLKCLAELRGASGR